MPALPVFLDSMAVVGVVARVPGATSTEATVWLTWRNEGPSKTATSILPVTGRTHVRMRFPATVDWPRSVAVPVDVVNWLKYAGLGMAATKGASMPPLWNVETPSETTRLRQTR